MSQVVAFVAVVLAVVSGCASRSIRGVNARSRRLRRLRRRVLRKPFQLVRQAGERRWVVVVAGACDLIHFLNIARAQFQRHKRIVQRLQLRLHRRRSGSLRPSPRC